MARNKNERWKRLRRWAAVLALVVLFGGWLAFTRLHFSTQSFPWLAEIQWTRTTRVASRANPFTLIGHRGSAVSSADGQFSIGNTANAIRDGIAAGVDWIEIDVRCSRDRRLVVFHDAEIDRKTTGVGKVCELTLSQLQDVEVRVVPREKILSLEQAFLRFHDDDKKWILDVKEPGIHKELLAWLANRIARGELSSESVILFGESSVLRDYQGSGYALGYTVLASKAANGLEVLVTPSQIIDRCELLGCDYLVLPIVFASKSLTSRARARGIRVWVYGSDQAADLRRLYNLAVDGAIVDSPSEAVEVLRPLANQGASTGHSSVFAACDVTCVRFAWPGSSCDNTY